MGKYVLGHDLKGEGKLRNDLISSDQLNDALVDTFLGYCADPHWWTETIAFTAVHGRR